MGVLFCRWKILPSNCGNCLNHRLIGLLDSTDFSRFFIHYTGHCLRGTKQNHVIIYIFTTPMLSAIDKKSLSERDICTKYISPAIKNAGWDIETQVLEEVSFTDGRIYVKGKLTARGTRKRADY